MKSALQFDKELGINKYLDYDDELKLGSARTYRDELKHVLWRERMDLAIAQHQVDSADDDNFKAQHMGKVNESKTKIKQMIRSIESLNSLVDELDAKVTK